MNADTSLITMSIGGNDAGFSDDLKSCYEPGQAALVAFVQLRGADHQRQNRGRRAERNRRSEGAARARAPRPDHPDHLPQAVPRPAHGHRGLHHGRAHLPDPGGSVVLHQEAVGLDDAICAAAQAAGVGAECINASDAFAGCEIGQSDPCLQAPSSHISGSTGLGINPGAYHPTQKGQQILGQLIDEEIQSPPPGSGPS